MRSAVASLPGATVAGAGAGCNTGGAATVGAELRPCQVAVATGSSVGVTVATGPATDVVDDDAGVAAVTDADVVGGGASAGCNTGGVATVGAELGPCPVAVATGPCVGVAVATGLATDVVDDDAGGAAVTDADVVGGGASAPTAMVIMDAPSATPPAARLPNRAQPTWPRAKAITATTSANNPSIIAAPLKPDLMTPITPARVRPPQPNASAAPNLRPLAGAACFDACPFFNIGKAIVASNETPEMQCSVHNSPSQHLC